MGKTYSYFNIWAISSIIDASIDDVEKLLQYVEINNNNLTLSKRNDHNTLHQESQKQTINYFIHKDKLLECLNILKFNSSDIDIISNLFVLIDKYGFSECDIREVMISFLLLCSRDITICFQLSMDMINRDKTQYLDKVELLRIFTILNDTCYYFGDKYLTTDQIKDLIDSLYTSIGIISR